jgi:hypothetical protein
MKRMIVIILGFIFIIASLGFGVYYYRSHTANDAEDRRRWLREIDKDLEQQGFIKGTNGELIFVGTNKT